VEWELDDVICIAMSLGRPFGYIHDFIAGSQKSIQEHFSLFHVDQLHVGGL